MKIKFVTIIFINILFIVMTGCSSNTDLSNSGTDTESSSTESSDEYDSEIENSSLDDSFSDSSDEESIDESSSESSDEENIAETIDSLGESTLQGTIVEIEITDDRKFILIDTTGDDDGDKQLLVTQDVEVYGPEGSCELSDLSVGNTIAVIFSGETLEDDPGQVIDVSFILVYDPSAGLAAEDMTIQGTITEIDADQSYLLIDVSGDGKGDRELSLLDDVQIYSTTGLCTLSDLEVNQTIAAIYSGMIIEASPGIADGVSLIIAYK